MDNLPEDILVQIFEKLPMKTLGLCMCVKKPWLSHIKNSSFVYSYTNIVESEPQLIFWTSKLKLQHSQLNGVRNLEISYVPDSYSKFRSETDIVTCNGVLCFAKDENYIVLCNPTIQKTLNLPSPNDPTRRRTPDDLVVGFAFDALTNDYKVFRILSRDNGKSTFQSFSLNRNSWNYQFARGYSFSKPMLPNCNNALHCIGYNFLSSKNAILGFHVHDEMFLEIDLPKILQDVNGEDMKLAVYKDDSIAVGYFSYRKIDVNGQVWLMKEYNNVESWTLLWEYGNISNYLPNGDVHWYPYGYYWDSVVSAFGFENNWLLLQVGESIVVVDPETADHYWEDLEAKIKRTSSLSPYFKRSLLLLENSNAVSYFDFEKQIHTKAYFYARSSIPDEYFTRSTRGCFSSIPKRKRSARR